MFAERKTVGQRVLSVVSAAAILALMISFAFVPSAQAQISVVSPEVAADGTVTFRYYDPNADLVQVYLEHGRNAFGAWCYAATGWPIYDMTMDASGVWSFTIQLEPNLYNYRFIVHDDGMTTDVVDPANPAWDSEAINGQVWVPGEAYEWVSEQDVPHGQLEEVYYYSDITGTMRPLAVYTPPDYDNNNRTYPTVYLSHGAGGNHIDWSTQGAANNILDNLIAEKKIRPVVVVMTNFNDIPGFLDGYRMDLIQSAIPFVEENYRVNRNPQQRAFGGLSMGGFAGSNILLNNPEAFGFIGLWSGANIPADSPGPENKRLYQMRGLHIGIGAQDFLYDLTMSSVAVLDANGIEYDSLFTEGDCHTWYYWREALRDFLLRTAF